MRFKARWMAVLAVALLCWAGPLSLAADEVTMEGEFVWTRSDGDTKGDLKAIFTPTGQGTWDVAFHFDWEDGPHVYAGTAKGDLTGGQLEGEVQNDSSDRKATFQFSGTIEDGAFAGTHGHLSDGKLNDTGTMTLKKTG